MGQAHGNLTAMFGVLAGLLCAGCSPPIQAPVAAGKAAATGSLQPLYVAPTDAACEALAAQLGNAIAQKDAAAMRQLIDWDAVIDRGLHGLGLAPAEELEFRAGFKQSSTGPLSFEFVMIKAVHELGNSFQLLRLHEKDGMKRALFRQWGPSGLNYQDFVLARRPDGTTRVIDIYLFASGEMFSESLRRTALSAITAQKDRPAWAKLTGKHSEFVQSMPDFKRMIENVHAQNFQEVLNIYRTLPPSLQQDKNALLIRYQAATQISTAELAAAIEDLLRHYPNEAWMDLLLIDHYALQKDYSSAHAAINRLDEEVKDPYLNVLRIGIFHLEGNTAEVQRLTAQVEADGIEL